MVFVFFGKVISVFLLFDFGDLKGNKVLFVEFNIYFFLCLWIVVEEFMGL